MKLLLRDQKFESEVDELRCLYRNYCLYNPSQERVRSVKGRGPFNLFLPFLPSKKLTPFSKNFSSSFFNSFLPLSSPHPQFDVPCFHTSTQPDERIMKDGGALHGSFLNSVSFLSCTFLTRSNLCSYRSLTCSATKNHSTAWCFQVARKLSSRSSRSPLSHRSRNFGRKTMASILTSSSPLLPKSQRETNPRTTYLLSGTSGSDSRFRQFDPTVQIAIQPPLLVQPLTSLIAEHITLAGSLGVASDSPPSIPPPSHRDETTLFNDAHYART